jgi:transposase
MDRGYQITGSIMTEYGGVRQRWIMIDSQQARKSSEAAFRKRIETKKEQLDKDLWHLQNQGFACKNDLQVAIAKIRKRSPYFEIKTTTIERPCFEKKGRPKTGSIPSAILFTFSYEISLNFEAISRALLQKGRFILATNQMDSSRLSDTEIFQEYKNQQDTERGFRFLKSSDFMVSSVFLKSPRRIEALCAVMGLCLMVYSVGQHFVRSHLRSENLTVPNQKRKPIQNPTLRWIFQCFEGVIQIKTHHLSSVERSIHNFRHEFIPVINCLGPFCQQIYGFP